MGFGYDNSVSSQTDDVGHVGAAVLSQMTCVVGLETNDVRRNWKGLKIRKIFVPLIFKNSFWNLDNDGETWKKIDPYLETEKSKSM